MTPANRRRLMEISDRLREIAEERLSAQDLAMVLLDEQERLTVVVKDVIFRPDVNGGPR